MGTQPSGGSTGRGTKIKKKLKHKISDSAKKGDFDKAISQISKDVIKSDGGANVLAGILAAGIIAYAASKEPTERSIKQISGDAISKIPYDIKDNLSLAGKDSIRLAVYNALSKRND